ncbi:ComF family protein [Dyadobacter arcticus]|uniref:ComF family protein n=1 Tax=Dyadobacter arcticus TaxID=1078754 RepID=A0ABX0UD41_9BACT|nr:ComF family protein [Dyadobacter arcticus]NIJ50933.1 ComF family protein [Dyadobacter arcticus]
MIFKTLLSDFIDLLFPRCCEGCEHSLVGNEETLCTICRVSLPRIGHNSLNLASLQYKFVNVPEVVSSHSFLLFTKKGKVQKLLHAFKYRGNKEVGILLGSMFGEELIESGSLPPADLIISVPLHEKKKKIRGYNQSDLLAEGFSRVTGIPWTGTALQRIRYTETQTGKSKLERRENVKGVFEIKEKLDQKSIIIMDDVLTTGATLEECVQTLLMAGCKQFYILTIALAQH